MTLFKMRLVNPLKSAFWKINITIEWLSLIIKLAKYFIDNPILPFDKPRSITNLTYSSHLIIRTILSMLLFRLFSIFLFMSYISNLKKPSCFASHWLVKKESSNTRDSKLKRQSHIHKTQKSQNTLKLTHTRVYLA